MTTLRWGWNKHDRLILAQVLEYAAKKFGETARGFVQVEMIVGLGYWLSRGCIEALFIRDGVRSFVWESFAFLEIQSRWKKIWFL